MKLQKRSRQKYLLLATGQSGSIEDLGFGGAPGQLPQYKANLTNQKGKWSVKAL